MINDGPKLLTDIPGVTVHNRQSHGEIWTTLSFIFGKIVSVKKLTIVVPEGDNNISSITGTYEIFQKAEQYWQEKGNRKMFTIRLAGTSDHVEFSGGLFTITPDVHINDIRQTDLVVVPSLNHNYEKAMKNNGELIEWLAVQYKNGASIATICTGAFALAATGLLDGKSCSTHWSVSDKFRTLFPEVKLQPDKLITDEQGIYTNGGAYSFLNLVIYLIEKYYDRDTAIYCSKVFQVEIDRNMQAAFSIFNGHKKHKDNDILLAQQFIEDHYHERISIEKLSYNLNIGRRNFDRRFIRATGVTPIDYLQRVKIEAAKKAFESTRKTVNEIMYEVGYNDSKAFRDVFNKITGLTPLAYKEKYQKAMTV